MKARKIIIEIRDGIPDMAAVIFVKNVIEDGMVGKDGQSYCHCTVVDAGRVAVFADVLKSGTHKFVVEKAHSEKF